MKDVYTIIALVCLMLVGAGCQEDYRDMVIFEGVEPIYQIGTCSNLVSSVTLYITDTEEIVLGIDGGDGNYNLFNEHESVAAVTFDEDVNGYRRIKVQPLAAGQTVLRITDGSGTDTKLYITVKNRHEYKMKKMACEYAISDGAPMDLLANVQKALAERPWLKDNGYYLLIPDEGASSFGEKGVLEIYSEGKENVPLIGRYDTIPVEDEEGNTQPVWQFTYGNEKRLYIRTLSSGGSNTVRCVLAENITEFCPSGLLPDGVTVVLRELFSLRMEE
nr:hypothetical protein [uncultured Bacteroides sp.]